MGSAWDCWENRSCHPSITIKKNVENSENIEKYHPFFERQQKGIYLDMYTDIQKSFEWLGQVGQSLVQKKFGRIILHILRK